ncbi:uncharacterized protein LOC125593864 [Brassica napus]|nr:uncharacterized protein LOC125593864 [Brassica napus]
MDIKMRYKNRKNKINKRKRDGMQDLQSPNIRSYKSYEGGRNLQLVDPADLKPVRGIYVVRELKRNRSPMTSDPWRKISYKDMPVKSRRPPSHSKTLKGWWNDPEIKRKRRVAKYKLYSAEGKVKKSLKKSYKWIKIQCAKIIHGI